MELDGNPVAPEPREVYAVNKPAGVVSTARDTHGRPTVVELVRSRRRLYPVGRLDADTTGLILLTNDGELAERLTHPRYGVEKLYRARVRPGRVTATALESLRGGVELDDGVTAPARVRLLRPGLVEIGIREGRKRQVRRMIEAVGHQVVELQRVAFGPLGSGASSQVSAAGSRGRRWSACAGRRSRRRRRRRGTAVRDGGSRPGRGEAAIPAL